MNPIPARRRPGPSPRAALLRAMLVLGSLVLVTAGLAVAGWFLRRSEDAAGRAARGGAVEPHSPRAASPRPGETPVEPRGESLSPAEVLRGVVVLETSAGSEHALGAGFVVDESGLIATSYHVVASATQARARFQDEATYEIEGYVAVDAAADLAVLKLKDAPRNLAVLPLADPAAPAPLSPVAAAGHPQGLAFSLYDGRFSRVVPTSELPASSQVFLKALTGQLTEHRWLQHTAVLSPGNSGGPLIDELGRVIGVNTWVNRQTGFGYALHVEHLVDLLRRRQDSPDPLEGHASLAARAAAQRRRLSVGTIDLLARRAEEMRWRPVSAADYDVLAALAAAIVTARAPAEFTADPQETDETGEKLIREADRAVAGLERQKWKLFDNFTIVNELASLRIDEPLAGLFFFGTVDGVFSGDGTRGMLVRPAGFERPVFISLGGLLVSPAAGQQCLVLGVTSGQQLRYGPNPLALQAAPVIELGALILYEE